MMEGTGWFLGENGEERTGGGEFIEERCITENLEPFFE